MATGFMALTPQPHISRARPNANCLGGAFEREASVRRCRRSGSRPFRRLREILDAHLPESLQREIVSAIG
jgi:hypothetical protein